MREGGRSKGGGKRQQMSKKKGRVKENEREERKVSEGWRKEKNEVTVTTMYPLKPVLLYC